MRRWLFICVCTLLLWGCGAAEITPEPTLEARPTSVPTEAVAEEPAARPTTDTSAAQPIDPVLPVCADVPQYPAEPELTIDPAQEYQATLKTAKGDVVIRLFPEYAPRTVNSFVFLAREGYYDNVSFHRVLPGFVAQTGDPSGSGMCGPGYEFANEYDPASDLDYSRAGIVGMANSGPNTNGSQFFITYANAGLPPQDYTIFGEVVEGMDVLQEITPRDPQLDPTAAEGDLLYTIEISEQ